MELKIKPLDTLFFRDGKPFARGDETWADSNFPPNPSVIYGAMRTALATVEGKEIPFENVPTQLQSENFKLKGIYFNHQNTNYLPVPLDLIEYKSEADGIEAKEKHTLHLLQKSPIKSVISKRKSFLKFLLHPEKFEQGENLDGGLISENQMNAYLNGTKKTFSDAIKLGDFVKSEPKVGIGRENQTRTAEEGLLYRVDTKRLEDIELRIIANSTKYGGDDVTKSIVHLGGERKLIQFKKIGLDTLDIEKPNLKKGQFKIYLLTPAIFTNLGWQPDLSKLEITANLVAACVGKPISIGGYDIMKNEPKPMLKAVPAGSVYYYESDEEPSGILDKIHSKSISDINSEQGFGIAFIGNF